MRFTQRASNLLYIELLKIKTSNMKKLIQLLLTINLIFNGIVSYGQGLEDIIVETYYVHSDNDKFIDSLLPEGSITYRIYIDMAEGYNLQALFGIPRHELCIETTTKFYNTPRHGSTTGYNIKKQYITENSVALDSWLTLGMASNYHAGVLKSEDMDGSLIDNEQLKKADGLTEGNPVVPFMYEADLEPFDEGSDKSCFKTKNSVIGILGGVTGPTGENRVLIAQITTDGKLSFKLNVQLGSPYCGNYEQYVANNASGNEILFDKLRYGKYK